MPLSIIGLMIAFKSSTEATFKESIVCFCTFVHPCVPRVIPLPQYSQVITISPNFGERGAPQLGHLNELTPEGATTCSGFDGAEAVPGICPALPRAVGAPG